MTGLLSKLCVVKERLKLLEKELSVMRIVHVLQFLFSHWAIVQSVGAIITSLGTSILLSTSTTFTLYGLIWINLSAFLYQRLFDNISKLGDVLYDLMRDTYLSYRARVRRYGSVRAIHSRRRLSHFHVSFSRHSYTIIARQVPSATNCPPALVHG